MTLLQDRDVFINPSVWRYLNPCSYWAVGWFSAGYLNFEPNCGIYSVCYIFFNNRWISMKLAPKYSRTSNLFEYAIKSCLKIQLGVKCLETALNTKSSLTVRAPKHSLLLIVVVVVHYTPFCWLGLFLCRLYSFGKMYFEQSRHIFVSGMTALHFPFSFTAMFIKQSLYQIHSEFKILHIGLA